MLIYNYILTLSLVSLCSYISANNNIFLQENGVYVVTESNLNKLQKSTKYLIVEFYYQECSYCNNFAPIYSKTALEFPKNKITYHQLKFGKVDVAVYPNLSTKYKVVQFPTIILLDKDSDLLKDYNGDLNYEEFKKWVDKNTFNSIISLNSIQSYNNFIKEQNQNQRSALIFFKDAKRLIQETAFTQVSKGENNFEFGICNFSECHSLGSSGSIKIHHPSGSVFKLSDDFDFQSLSAFILKHAHPFVMPFNFQASEVLFAKNKPGMFLYRYTSDAGKYDEVFAKAAKYIKEKSFNVRFYK